MKPLYVMLVGLPAGGKTTLARKIVDGWAAKNWHVASTDDYVETEAERRGTTYNDVFSELIDPATKDMNLRRQEAIEARRNIIHDQTNLTKKSRARKLAALPKDYVRVGILCDAMSLERARRLADRPGKVIPAAVDHKMATTFEPLGADEFKVKGIAEEWFDLLEAAESYASDGVTDGN